MKKLFGEFREFIQRGNVLDMAVGVIIATAFGKITTSLVNDLLMPFLGWIFGAQDLSTLNVMLAPPVTENGEIVKEAVTLGFGTFIGAIIDFILIALVVFAQLLEILLEDVVVDGFHTGDDVLVALGIAFNLRLDEGLARRWR